MKVLVAEQDLEVACLFLDRGGISAQAVAAKFHAAIAKSFAEKATASFEPNWTDQERPPPIDEHGQILCGVCGSSFVHIEACSTIQNRKMHMVTCAGVHIKDNEPSIRASRGSEIRIAMWCESGHRFGIVLAFHKGNTTIECFNGPTFMPGDLDECPLDLWRD